LYKGNITITGRKSSFSLYDANIASMDDDEGAYDQSKARGFIDILALPLRVQAMKKKKQ
jgi:argininosuccinate synthase